MTYTMDSSVMLASYSIGKVNRIQLLLLVFGLIVNTPPCASIIERQIARPIPRQCAFVEKKVLNTFCTTSLQNRGPVSFIVIATVYLFKTVISIIFLLLVCLLMRIIL